MRRNNQLARIMGIKGFVGVSLVDWDGKVSSVIFLPSCNMRCPFCYNTRLVLQPDEAVTIELGRVIDYLGRNKPWIDGVVITGGEPTLSEDLPALCQELKKTGLSVKVDTNGTNPSSIRKLHDNGLIDYVAMDVKAPLNASDYSRSSGVNMTALLGRIEETINTLLESGIEHEFRTTLVPALHGVGDIEKICEQIEGCRKYALQNFKSSVQTIDPSFQTLKPFSKTEMENFLEIARRFIPNTILRD